MKKALLSGVAVNLMVFGAAYAADMPVDRVILSTSGLAQFEHQAKVKGNAALAFPVRLEQVDDILKSLVIYDAKGRVGSVTLPGKQPLDQVFKNLPFNRQQLANAMLLLNSYQGASVTVKDSGGINSGKIIQVTPEVVTLEEGKTMTKHRLRLMTDEGIKQVVLEDVQSLHFTDEKIRNEIAGALAVVRENSTSGQRLLTVNMLGSEERNVTLSYVVEAPLWKTAYRMVVPETGKTEGLLQGWAVVENMTAGDWENVDLSLVSGNPVTFRQALYQSYYVSRPEIPVQVFGLVLPQIDQGTIATADVMQDRQIGRTKQKAMFGGGMSAMEESAVAPTMMAAPEMERDDMDTSTGMVDMAGMANVAASSEAMSQVLFRFPDRVSVKSGQSMMLPFVSRALPMERLSVYQPETNAQHPLSAVEVKNSGDTALPPGVLTLYAENKLLKGAGFSGDAQLPSLAAGEKRLVSYALDTKTTIDRQDKHLVTEDQMTASQGIIRTTMKERAETIYTVKAPTAEDRVVIIEHPRMGDYKLVEPDPKSVEVTDRYFRIRVAAKAGETKPVKVVLEHQSLQTYEISGLETDMLLAYASTRGELKPEIRKQFEEIARLRQELDKIDQKMAEIESRREQIFQDQARVRENPKSLNVKSEVQQKYLDKLNEQEDDVAALDKEKEALTLQRQQALSVLEGKISSLSF